MIDAKYRVRVNREPILTNERGRERKKKWLKWSLIGGGALLVVLVVLILIGGRGGKPEEQTQTPDAPPEVRAIVEKGDVQVKGPDADDFEDISEDMVIAAGSTIRTEKDSIVSLETATGSVARLNGSSRMSVETITADELHLDLDGGEMWVRLVGSDPTPVKLTTLEVRVEAQGSAYNIKHGQDQSTINSVADTAIVTALRIGEGGVTNDLGKILLEEDNQTIVKAADLPESEEDFDTSDSPKEFKESFWYRFNMEKDEEFEAKITGKEDENAPSLNVTEPKDKSETDDETVTVKGNTDISATVEINGEEVENKSGKFEKKVNLEEGDNTITVTATDKAGNKAEKKISIKRKLAAPGAVSLSAAAEKPGEAALTWGKSDADDFAEYVVKRNENAIKRYSDINKTNHTDTGLEAGKTYKYKVCVVDKDDQETCSSEKSVTIKAEPNKPPTVSISSPANNTSFAGGAAVSFTANGSDPDGGTLTYTWDFGDGVTTTGQSVSHTYAAVTSPTNFTVTVKVSDRAGATAKATVTITITP